MTVKQLLRSAQRTRLFDAIAASLLMLAVSGCATNPATGKKELSLMSEAQELSLGEQSDAEVRREMGVYDDRELQQYVADVGMRLARVSERPNLPWRFTVVDTPAVNAFALPGGYIYITRGIMPYLDSEAQLAGVLGHEIGHVTARHASQQYSKSTAASLGLMVGAIFAGEAGAPIAQLGSSGLGLLMLKYSRDDEAQADGLGVRYAARAGWDPDGVPQMLTTLGRIDEASDNKGVPDWLQTHPAPVDRVRRVQAAVRDAESGEPQFTVDRDEYLTRIRGLVFGDNPEQGVVRGSTFLHSRLRFSLEFPAGWTVTNSASQVTAKDPSGHSVLALQLMRQRQGGTLRDVALVSMQRSGLRARSVQETTVDGLPASVGTYEGVLQGRRVEVRAAHIQRDRDIFLVAGIAAADSYAGVESEFSKSIQSFHALSREEAEAVRPNRVDLCTARAGETWASLADQHANIVKAATLATMNDRLVTDQIQPGERLKIVVGD